MKIQTLIYLVALGLNLGCGIIFAAVHDLGMVIFSVVLSMFYAHLLATQDDKSA